MNDGKASLSLQAAADHLAIPRNDMVILIEQGAIAAHFEGWNLRISADAIEEFERDRRAAAAFGPQR